MITISANPKMKYVMQLQKKSRFRREEGAFVVEGPKMFLELPRERIRQSFVSESFVPGHEELIEKYGCEIVKDAVFREVSDTQTPQGVLAVAEQYRYTAEDMLSVRPAQLLVLENIQDPGNLGTMLRTGEAAGVTGVIMSRNTVDIYSPKVVRATMGAVFRVPFVTAEDLEGGLKWLKEKGVRLYAAHLQGAVDYDGPDYCQNCGFLIGNEASGLREQTAALADARIKIPMCGKVESLNAAVAASVLVFEAARQRRKKS